jgi:hypothetical protein
MIAMFYGVDGAPPYYYLPCPTCLPVARIRLIHAHRAQILNMPKMSSPFATFLIIGRKNILTLELSHLGETTPTNTTK